MTDCTSSPDDVILRDPRSFSANRYDLIVVGGGIYGTTLLLEAVRRGLSCLLLEKDDFGANTSYNHLRILHGGLRYLQSFDLRRFRESVAERSWFLRFFPNLAQPLNCLLPLYGQGLHRPDVFRAALALDSLLGIDRNRGLLVEQRLARGRVLSRAETIDLFPAVNQVGLKGCALWQDGFVPDSPRLLIELLRWTCGKGAHALNYFRAENLQFHQGRVTGIAATDQTDGDTYEFAAPVVINAAGPWCREISDRVDRDRPELFENRVLVWNLLFDRSPLSCCAVALAARDKGAHTYFAPPWKGQLLIGTGHAALLPDEHRPPTDMEILSMIDDLNRAVPGLDLNKSEVHRVFYGVMPGSGGVNLASRSVFINHGADGGPAGFFSVSGVKFTTARQVADETLRRIFPDRQPRPYGEGYAPSACHGKRGLALSADDLNDWQQLLLDESVTSLADLILRRSDLADQPLPSRSKLMRMAVLFSKDEEKQEQELTRLFAELA